MRKTVNTLFDSLSKHPLLRKESTVYLDLFNTGIIVNISKHARKYYPVMQSIMREIIEKEIKKL